MNNDFKMQTIPYRDLDFVNNYKKKSIKSLKRKAKLRALIRGIIPNNLLKFIFLNACAALLGSVAPIAIGIGLFLLVLYILFAYPTKKLLKLIDKIYFRGKYFNKKSNDNLNSNDIKESVVKKTYSHQPLFEKNFFKNIFTDPFDNDKVLVCISISSSFIVAAINTVSVLINFIK